MATLDKILSPFKNYPNPDEFASTINDVFDDSEKVSTIQKEKINQIISSYNQKAIEIERLRNAETRVGQSRVMLGLAREVKQDMKYLGSLNSYEDTKNYWTKTLVGFLKNEFGGQIPPDIQNYLHEVNRVIDEKQIRILWKENQTEAMDTLSLANNEYKKHLNEGKIIDAAQEYQRLQGALNNFEKNNILDKKLSSILRGAYSKSFNTQMLKTVLGHASLIGSSDGFSAQMDYFNKAKKLIDQDQLNVKDRKVFIDFEKYLNASEISLDKRLEDLDINMDNNLKLGLGNSNHIAKESKNVEKMINKRLAVLDPRSKEYVGLQALKTDGKAYRYLVSGINNALSLGSASKVSGILTLQSVDSYKVLLKNLGISDTKEQQSFITQHSILMQRYNYAKDPYGALYSLSRDFSTSDDGVAMSADIISKLNDETKTLEHITGKRGLLSENSERDAVDILSMSPNNEEDFSLQKNMENFIKSRGIDVAAHVQERNHPTVGRDSLHYVMKNSDAFTFISPDRMSWSLIKENYKNYPGFKTAVGKVSDHFIVSFGSEIEEIANATYTTQENVANMMALDLVQGTTRGINGSPLGARGIKVFKGLNIFSRTPDKFGISDELESYFKSTKERLLKGFSVYSKGKTVVNHGGSLDTHINNRNVRAYNVLKLFNSSTRSGRLLDIADWFSDTGSYNKGDIMKFYNSIGKLTGMPKESFLNRLVLKQSSIDKNYYLFMDNGNGSRVPLEYLEKNHISGQLKITEDDMLSILTGKGDVIDDIVNIFTEGL